MLWATLASWAWEESDYPFVDDLGRPYRPETLSRKFAKLTADAGLRPIRLHDTRRTVAAVAGQAFFLVKQGVGGPTGNLGPRPVVMESGWSELRNVA